MFPYRLVLFDLDGTILNTLEDLKNSVNASLAAFGFPERSVKTVRALLGNGVKNLMTKSAPEGTPEETVEELISFFNGHYAAHSMDRTGPYDGMTELVKDLRQAGIRCAVISNKPDYAVGGLCERFYPGLFDLSVGERAGIRRKPAPDMIFSALERLGETLSGAVYIGDSEVDLATAKNAGMDCIAVDWGFRDREELYAAGAETVVSSPAELRALLLPKG